MFGPYNHEMIVYVKKRQIRRTHESCHFVILNQFISYCRILYAYIRPFKYLYFRNLYNYKYTDPFGKNICFTEKNVQKTVEGGQFPFSGQF